MKTVAVLSLIAALMLGCGVVSRPPSRNGVPRIVAPQDIRPIIGSISRDIGFGYWGLAFFKGNLYASSNIGLLEYEGNHLSRLYKWSDDDDVVSEPWLDHFNNALCLFHEGQDAIIRYDGWAWTKTMRPTPEGGLSRGAVMAGFRGSGNSSGFWLEGGGHVWEWFVDNWVTLDPIPPSLGTVARIVPLESQLLYVIRQKSWQLWTSISVPDPGESDVVYYFDNQWKVVPNVSKTDYYAQETVSAGNVGFIRTKQGKLLRATPTDITSIECPGVCEALAVTPSGVLLASFIGIGICAYEDGWHKRWSSPYSESVGKHWAFLAASKDRVAFAITAESQDSHWWESKPETFTGLWISDGSELKAITLGER